MDAFWEFVGSWTFILLLGTVCALVIPATVVVVLLVVLWPKKRKRFDDEY
jgi:hypothetical protein